MQGAPRISIRELTKVYRTRRGDTLALDHVSLTVGEGEILVLLGPSGCGKTTLLRCVAGLETPDAGRIEVHQRTVFDAEQRQLSMVFQSYALWPHMTVHDNVAYPLQNARVERQEIRERVQAVLGVVGLASLAGAYPGQLSGGQQQRVALVLAGLMLVVVQGLLLLQRRLAPPGQSASVGGRGFRSARVGLGSWRPWARGLMLAYLVLTALLPVAGLLLVSLQGFWSPNIQWDKLTLGNYQAVLLQRGSTSQALLDSIGLGIVAATLGTLAAGVLMLYVHQARGRGRRLVDAVTTLPATIPHTVIGVSVLIAFSRPPVSLYGSLAILLVAYLIQALPYAARSASAAVADIGLELAEASRVAGASERRTFRRVLLPIALPGLAAGWTMLFILSAGEVTASALLSTTSNPVIGRVMLDVSNFGSYPQVCALAVVITLINAAFVLVVLRLTRRGLDAALR